MTTIYVPRPVSTVEEVEAVPPGTIFTHPNMLPVEVWGDQYYGDPGLDLTPADLVGCTALIPTVVDVEESEPLGTTRHVAGHIERHPFTCYIAIEETP